MSTLVALAILAAWLVIGTWRTRRWEGIQPPDIVDAPDDNERWGRLQSFLGLQARTNVGRWRRTIVTLGAAAIILGWGIVEDERRDVQRENDRQERAEQIEEERAEREREQAEQACRIRVESRAEVRSAISVAIDVIARYAQLEPPDRSDIIDQVDAAVYEELPPPDC